MDGVLVVSKPVESSLNCVEQTTSSVSETFTKLSEFTLSMILKVQDVSYSRLCQITGFHLELTTLLVKAIVLYLNP